MSLWTLEQGESFFKDTGKTSLSSTLLSHLGISQVLKHTKGTRTSIFLSLDANRRPLRGQVFLSPPDLVTKFE
jgi:hypothetical protein